MRPSRIPFPFLGGAEEWVRDPPVYSTPPERGKTSPFRTYAVGNRVIVGAAK